MSRRLLSLPSVGSRWYSLALLAATVLMVLAVLAGGADTADAASPSEQRKFKTQFQGKFDTSALATGVAVPAGAGFGETVVVAHKCDMPFFTVGDSASAGVQALAEGGSTSDFQAEVTAAVAAGNAQASWTIDSPNSPTGNKNGPSSVPVEDEFSCLTILVKINPTSDWFAGVSAYDLRSGGTWPTPGNNNNIFIDLFPFDAGTLDGTEFATSTTATSPQGTIASLRNSGKFSNNKIARLKLTLKNPALTKDVAAEEAIESIIVTWGEVVAAGGYHVMWKSGVEVFDTDGSLGRRDVVGGGTTKTHTITGLTGGIEHEVQVIAYNEAGQSSQDPTSESKDRATPISAATAGNTVLVGNTTQRIPGTERLTIGSNAQYRARAQAFTTGSDPAVLGSVTLPDFRKESNNSVVDVHIYSASGVDPDAELHTLTRPDFSSFSSGVPTDITFNAAAADTITLAINTTYFVVVESVQEEVGLAHTKDDDEDPATDEGWSIANTCRREHRDGTPNSDCERTGSSTAALIMVLNSPLEADKPVLSISGSEAVEGTGIQFTVSLSPALGEEVTVEYSTADDTATTANSDYTAVTASTLTFAANETEKTVTIATTADSTDEDDESFNVVLSSPSENAQLGYVTSASSLIINNDQTTQTDGTLSSITLTGSDGNTIALTPTFGQYKFLYMATANRDLDSLTGVVVPSTTGTVQNIMYVGGNEDTDTTAYDAVWPLVPGDNLVKFMVTSPDGSRTKIYKIHVNKDPSTDATLSALTVNDGPNDLTLVPAFAAATYVYAADVANAVDEVTLTSTLNHDGAKVSGVTLGGTAIADTDFSDGIAVPSLVVGDNEIIVTVTAEDPTATQTYTVTVTRAAANSDPTFPMSTASREVAENTAAGTDVGAVLTATDADMDTLTYTLEGTDSASFDLVTTSGSAQIQTKSGVTYNHEVKSSYTVTVKADDGNSGTAAITVTITITDVTEAPGRPAAPNVTATSGSTTSLDVSWNAPTNTGPNIDNYDLQYREGTSGGFTNGPQDVTGTSAAIPSLDAGTAYQVQVRATNDEGDSQWSTSGNGTTTALATPTVSISADKTTAVFREDDITYTLTRSGSTTAALPVMVTLTQTKNFLATTDLTEAVTIPAGQTTETFTVAASSFEHFAAGTTVEGGTLTAAVQDGADYDLGATSSVDVAIVIGVTVRFEMASYTIDEAGGTLSFKLIARTGASAPQPSSATGSVGVITEDGSASNTFDFAFTDGAENFLPGEFSADGGAWQAETTYNVSITNDALDEDDETFDLAIERNLAILSYSLVDASGNSCGTKCTVTVTITDDDTAGVTVSESALTVTEEDATGDTYTVVLDSKPTANVTISIGGQSGTDVTAAPSPMTFTPTNWATPQTVTVTAANDADLGNDMVSLSHSAMSSDGDYQGITIAGLTVTVNDNDTAQVTGVMVEPGNAQLVVQWTAVTNATGYEVQWKSGGESYNTSGRQATIGPGSTTSHTISSLSNGTEYTVRMRATRTGANSGAYSAEVLETPVMPTAAGATVSESALTVTEEDSTGDSYTVVLDRLPTASVTVTVAGHAGTDVTPAPVTLTFTTVNWQTAQTVTVTAGNDADTANDTVSLTHSAVSSDSAYQGITIAGVTVTVNDNDTAQVLGLMVEPSNAQLVVQWTAVANATGYEVQWKSGGESYNTSGRQATISSGSTTSHTISSLSNGTKYTVRVRATRTGANDGAYSSEVLETPVMPTAAGVTVSESALTVTEQDTTGDTYTVVLDSQPTANVTISIGGQPGTDVTAAPSPMTFTTTNWATPVTVTVTAGDDVDTTNDTVALTHSAASSDADYQGITIAGVTVTVNDNDTAQVLGLMITPGNAQLAVQWTAVSNATGYEVQWKSGGQSYNTSDRQATIASGATTSHTISSLSNGTEYTVRMRATRTGANSGAYSAEVVKTPVMATTEGVTVSKPTLTVGEQDATGESYTVVLDTQPTASVTVTVGGFGGTDVTANPATLTFTTTDWDTAQTVTVTAANDADLTNDTVSLTHSAASSDADYQDITIAGVTVTVTDNDGSPPPPPVIGGGGGGGGGAPANRAPEFVEGERTTRSVVENTPAGANIGEPVAATDFNRDTLTYSLRGAEADLFNLDASSGQLLTKAALDYETEASYVLFVWVQDNKNANGRADTQRDTVIRVELAVTNEDEAGAVALSSSEPDVDVAITAALTDPDGGLDRVVWSWERSADQTAWTAISGAASASYTPVAADKGSYLRATASYTDGHGPRKSAQAATSDPVPSNSAPVFTVSDLDTGRGLNGGLERSVAENTGEGEAVGAPVIAADAECDAMTCVLGGADADLFIIEPDTGQIRVGAGTALDYEADKNIYEVTVTATDSSGASTTVAVTIAVTNVGLGSPSGDAYDADGNEAIDRDEAIAALADYFSGVMTREEAIAVIQLYFDG